MECTTELCKFLSITRHRHADSEETNYKWLQLYFKLKYVADGNEHSQTLMKITYT